MRERAYSVGAKFSILSGLNHGIGAGTTIEVTIPHNKLPLDGVEV
jgi:signal transduction histidine kinase